MLFVELVNKEHPLWRQALALYDQTFPVEVRETHAIFEQSLIIKNKNTGDNFHFIVCVNRYQQVLSLATCHYFSKTNSGFIVYLVTNPSAKKQGIGSATLGYVEELLSIDAKKAGYNTIHAIVLETEKYELAHTEQEKKDSMIRDHFFQKNGFVPFLSLNYVQPPLHKEDDSVPLYLYAKSDESLSNEYILAVIRDMYEKKYDDINKISKHTLAQCLYRIGFESSSNT